VPFQITAAEGTDLRTVADRPEHVAFHGDRAGMTIWAPTLDFRGFDDPCRPNAAKQPLAAEVDTVIAYLDGLDAFELERLGTKTVGGHEAQAVDLVRGPACPDGRAILWKDGPESDEVAMDMHLVDRTRLLFLTVEDQLVIVEVWADNPGAWFPIAETLIGTLEFR
jgi:hypothetical protein